MKNTPKLIEEYKVNLSFILLYIFTIGINGIPVAWTKNWWKQSNCKYFRSKACLDWVTDKNLQYYDELRVLTWKDCGCRLWRQDYT